MDGALFDGESCRYRLPEPSYLHLHSSHYPRAEEAVDQESKIIRLYQEIFIKSPNRLTFSEGGQLVCQRGHPVVDVVADQAHTFHAFDAAF